jgi:hypothetical protein
VQSKGRIENILLLSPIPIGKLSNYKFTIKEDFVKLPKF